MTLNVEKIREDFPLLSREVNGKKLAYLDSAATSQKPLAVLEAMDSFYRNINANVHRGIHRLSEEATQVYENARQKTGEFINAQSADEIVFTKSATEALNLLAYSLTTSLKKGDEILLTQMEHHSNLVPWQQLAKERGIVVKFLDIQQDGTLDTESFHAICSKTKLVSLTHMSNVLGTINPVRELAKLAHENDALCIVDGAQSVPHFPVDVRKLGCDFLAFSGHKMLGPSGIGVLWGRAQLLERMDPFLYGGGMIQEVTFTSSTWNTIPWKFEAGTPPMAEAAGLAAAIDYLQNIGMDAIARHEQEITAYAIRQLEKAGARVYGPRERGGVVAFTIDGVHPHDVATLLDQDGIAVRAGHHCAMPLTKLLGVDGTTRASFYMYNTREEADRLARGVKNAGKVFA